ncbi:hypothetical protein HDU76_004732, partial [Blyttiomyces sp. JEL0837]
MSDQQQQPPPNKVDNDEKNYIDHDEKENVTVRKNQVSRVVEDTVTILSTDLKNHPSSSSSTQQQYAKTTVTTTTTTTPTNNIENSGFGKILPISIVAKNLSVSVKNPAFVKKKGNSSTSNIKVSHSEDVDVDVDDKLEHEKKGQHQHHHQKDHHQQQQNLAILQNVSVTVPAGQLMAIMGGSGSGKTTFLNALAGRSVGKVEGEILFNGRNPKVYIQNGLVAYVQQADSLLPYLTVRDTLRYAARLRLPRTMSLQEKYSLVESVILELGLKECANTLIGDEWRKGISGGEKRR